MTESTSREYAIIVLVTDKELYVVLFMRPDDDEPGGDFAERVYISKDLEKCKAFVLDSGLPVAENIGTITSDAFGPDAVLIPND